MTYQKCPVCHGTGVLSKLPRVVGDVDGWVDDGSKPSMCRMCGGMGVIKLRRDLLFMPDGEREELAKELIKAIKKWAERSRVEYTKRELMTISEVVTGSLFEEE